jgi:hypothetical protein
MKNFKNELKKLKNDVVAIAKECDTFDEYIVRVRKLENREILKVNEFERLIQIVSIEFDLD